MKKLNAAFASAAALAAATLGVPARSAPSQSSYLPAGNHYLDGQLVAKMLAENTACLNMEQTSCSAIETVDSITSTQIRISLEQFHVSELSELSGAVLLAHQLFPHTALAPDGFIKSYKLTFTITADGLCRTKEQAIADTDLLAARMVIFAKHPDGPTTPPLEGDLEDFRQLTLKAERAALGTMCFKYWFDPKFQEYLRADLFIGGTRQVTRPSYISFPKEGIKVHLRPQ